MGGFTNDLRYALRTLRKNRMVTLVATLSLGLAIAGNTVVFSLVNGLLFRPLPYEEPDRICVIGERPRDFPGDGISGVSPANFLDWRDRQQSFSTMAAIQVIPVGYAGESGEPESVIGAAITEGFFEVLGVQVARGRTILGEDVPAGADPVVVVSHAFWLGSLGGATGDLGSVELNGSAYEIIGVLPRDFEFLVPDLDFWVPLPLDREEATRQARTMIAFARLKDGVPQEQARAEMAAIADVLEDEYPKANRGFAVNVLNLRHDIPDATNRLLFSMLLGAMFFVLLIACANLANLLMARCQTREREVAIRAGLGADRWRLTRPFIIESGFMALLSGALGLGLSVYGVRVLGRVFAGQLPAPWAPVLDARVLLFTILVTLVGVVLLGLVPTFQIRRFAIAETLKEGASATSMSGSKRRLSRTLVVGEICLALILLGGAGVLIRSFQVMQSSDPGFETANLLTFATSLPESRYEDEASWLIAVEEIESRLRALPGVSGVLIANNRPRTPLPPQEMIDIEGMEGDDPQRVSRMSIGPRYFGQLGIPLLQGREFEEADRTGAPFVAVVNEAMARRYWGEGSPLGHRITVRGESFEIVGVVSTVRHGLLVNDNFEAICYLPWKQQPVDGFTVALLTEVPPVALTDTVRQAVLSFDPDLALRELQPMDDYLQQFFVGQRVFGAILGGFGILALLLAALGTYGVLAYTVVQRSQEIGIRMALGASRGGLLGMIARQGLLMAAIGIVLGIPGVVLVTRAISGALSAFVPIEPLAVVVVGLILVVVVVLASLVPATRAANQDPVVALRR